MKLASFSAQHGGKAAGLALMASLGLPVPSGRTLPGRSVANLMNLDGKGLTQTAEYSALLRFASRSWEKGLSVILRSSYSGEDSADASFAGQFETSGPIRSRGEFRSGLQRVLAGFRSTHSDRYRDSIGGGEGPSNGYHILIQEYAEPVCSGVAFGCNPVNGDSSVLSVSIIDGAGAALVSGERSGHAAIVDRKNLTLVQGSLPSSMEDTLQGLRDGIDSLEDEEPGAFADIEFVLTSDGLVFVQYRPVTTVLRVPRHVAQGRSFGREFLGEWLDGRVSPAFSTLLLPQVLEHSSEFFRNNLSYRLPSPAFLVYDGFVYVRERGSPSLVLAVWRFFPFARKAVGFWKSEAEQTISQIRVVPPYPQSEDAGVLVREIEHLASLSARLMALGLFTAPFAYGLEFLLRILYRLWLPHDSKLDYLRLVEGGLSRSRLAGQALSALSRKLRERHSEKGSEDPDLDPAAIKAMERLPEVQDYLNDYGHLAERFDLDSPTARETGKWVLDLMNVAEDSTTRPPTDTDENRSPNSIRPRGAWAILAPLLRSILGRLGELVSENQQIRDDRAFFASYGWDRIRIRMLRLGRLLAQRGQFGAAADIFRANWEEVRDAVSRRRQTVRLAPPRKERATQIPELFLNSFWPLTTLRKRLLYPRLSSTPVGETRLEKGTSSDHDLRGLPGAPGKATGPVVIARSLDDLSRASAGVVLVCRTTTPAWTSAFGKIAAVVTEIGNPLSHAAIVAREYGIPCVVAVQNATDRLASDQVVEVDGRLGVVAVRSRSRSPSPSGSYASESRG